MEGFTFPIPDPEILVNRASLWRPLHKSSTKAIFRVQGILRNVPPPNLFPTRLQATTSLCHQWYQTQQGLNSCWCWGDGAPLPHLQEGINHIANSKPSWGKGKTTRQYEQGRLGYSLPKQENSPFCYGRLRFLASKPLNIKGYIVYAPKYFILHFWCVWGILIFHRMSYL